MEQTDYARAQEEKHKRKIILPCIIPWEAGSNRFASQKGNAAFGTNRNSTLSVKSSSGLPKDDGSVPHITCPPMHMKCATQAGHTSFGSHREQVTRVTDKDSEDKVCINSLEDRMTKTILKKWDKKNKEGNMDLIGKRRDVIQETTGGRRFTKEELSASRCSIPRFQDPRNTVAGIYHKNGESFQAGMPRKATMQIEGLEDLKAEDRTKYLAWLGGQISMQTQSKTGGFAKTRDVVSTSYYHRLMDDRDQIQALKTRLEEEKKKEEVRDSDGAEEGEDIRKTVHDEESADEEE